MTKEVYDKIVEPVAPFEEIQAKPKTIAEYVEKVWGHELSKWQKEFITAMYGYYKNNPNGMVIYPVHGNGTTNILRFLAVVFAAYEKEEQ